MFPSNIIEIRKTQLYNPNVNSTIKIASIGDIHISKLVGIKDIENILQSLNIIKPDYICFVGDLIDSPTVLFNDKKVYELKYLIEKCGFIAQTMIVLGNHDFIDKTQQGFPDVFDETSVWNEINDGKSVFVLNDKLHIDSDVAFYGYRQKRNAYYFSGDYKQGADNFYNDLNAQKEFHQLSQTDKFNVFLGHSPEFLHLPHVQELLRFSNLCLTGHLHNGCVPYFLDKVLPPHIGIITPDKKLFPKNARGIFKLGAENYLIHGGGYTKISESAPKIFYPLDAWCTRQIDLIIVSPGIKPSMETDKTKLLRLKR